MDARMTVRSVADVLISFGSYEPVEVQDEDVVDSAATGDDAEDAVAARDRAIAAARDDGLTEGLTRAAAAHAAALEAERDASAERLAAERELWAREEGHILAEKVDRGLAEIEVRIAAHTARILRGMLADGLIDRAIRELAEHLHALLSGANGKLVEVSGPEDLVSALSAKLGTASAAIELRPGASADVRVVCDDTLVESRLNAWLARLATAVE
jgi:hypothetical protein